MTVRPALAHELPWLETRANWAFTRFARALAAVDSSGRLRGMVAFDNRTPNACHVHMAAETPIAWRRLVPACFEVLFVRLGLGVLIGEVPSCNTSSLRMTRTLGFRETHRVRDGWEKGVDIVVHELRRDDIPERAAAWLRQKASA